LQRSRRGSRAGIPAGAIDHNDPGMCLRLQ